MGVKVNIIGLGIMGKSVAKTLARNQNVEITAVCDLKPENLSIVKEELSSTETYTDYEKMINSQKPDAVYICTPDWAHYEPVLRCLDAGINVHVEKPLTTSVEQAAKIVQKVKKTGLKLQVSFNHRWLAPYYSTYQMVRQGKIGAPLTGYARKNNPISVPTKMIPWAKNSSPMWFLSCHDIDLICWWLNDDPVEVTAYGVKSVLKDKFGWDTYDAMQALVRFSKGAFFTFEAAWIYPETHPAMPDSFMEIIGQKGHFHLDRKTEAIEMSSEEKFDWPRSLLNCKVFDKWVGAFPSCVNSFIDAIVENRTPYDGWRATAVLDAAHKSADSGKTITVSKS
jgi:predicted dehydrogenase